MEYYCIKYLKNDLLDKKSGVFSGVYEFIIYWTTYFGNLERGRWAGEQCGSTAQGSEAVWTRQCKRCGWNEARP